MLRTITILLFYKLYYKESRMTKNTFDSITDYQRGYFEARGMIGTTYMDIPMYFKRPDWHDQESEEYKKGFRAGIRSLRIAEDDDTHQYR